MKRSEQLKSLSHEHHHALFIAKRLRDEGSQAGEAFVEFWRGEGEAHFRIEEVVLLPGSGLEGPGSDPDVARMLDEHLVAASSRPLAGRALILSRGQSKSSAPGTGSQASSTRRAGPDSGGSLCPAPFDRC